MGLLSALLALISGPALSDTEKGIAAYKRGDYPLALRELQSGAEAGDEQALYNLGVFYSEGKAAPADAGKAIGYYRRAAEAGSALAAFNLAQALRKGNGVAQDYVEAAKWYEQAARNGDYRAGNELGLLYVEGKGVDRDLVEGFAWIYPATHAAIMDDNALQNAMQLASMLDRSQLDEAQQRGKVYYERYFEPNSKLVDAIRKGQ